MSIFNPTKFISVLVCPEEMDL